MTAYHTCEKLSWDSKFFGFSIARVKSNRLKAGDMDHILDWCSRKEVRCLYFLADIDDAETSDTAERNGFHLVDVRVTMVRASDSKDIADSSSARANRNALIRNARPSEIDRLENITENSYRDSRFYFDTRFPCKKADAMYRIWIRKSCQGYADRVLVMERRKQLCGFITCNLVGHTHGNIGLVGVSASQRGQLVGECLVRAALRWFAGQRVTDVSVVTQGRNIKAQRLYERQGFVTQSLQLWYHKWIFPEDAT